MRANILTLVSALALALSGAGCLLQPLSPEEAAELRAEVESMGLGELDLDFGPQDDSEPGEPDCAPDSAPRVDETSSGSTVIDTSYRAMGGSAKPDPTPWVTATPDGKPDPTPWRTTGDGKPDPTPWYPTSESGGGGDETITLYSNVEGKPDPTPW
jgi:hypothetical protein